MEATNQCPKCFQTQNPKFSLKTWNLATLEIAMFFRPQKKSSKSLKAISHHQVNWKQSISFQIKIFKMLNSRTKEQLRGLKTSRQQHINYFHPNFSNNFRYLIKIRKWLVKTSMNKTMKNLSWILLWKTMMKTISWEEKKEIHLCEMSNKS